ncbi:hypothetical protein CEXT_792001 [Caerostris extrusa]|uniref:Uncharacterized protein n=1 Tax=Caerostris extrusa TaxID=172846 RepID=A0AAV4VCK9_CAEEX|nr:hypothetical protein CEXT_792001 [Caerostris extrusa]
MKKFENYESGEWSVKDGAIKSHRGIAAVMFDFYRNEIGKFLVKKTAKWYYLCSVSNLKKLENYESGEWSVKDGATKKSPGKAGSHVELLSG